MLLLDLRAQSLLLRLFSGDGFFLLNQTNVANIKISEIDVRSPHKNSTWASIGWVQPKAGDRRGLVPEAPVYVLP